METRHFFEMVAGLLILVALSTSVGMYFSYNNKELALRKEIIAQRGKVEGTYDAMWKILSQQAQVSNEYKEAFKEIYPDLIAGRYSQGDGSLMKWVQEANPQFDIRLYDKLMQSIEVQRLTFKKSQERMLDLIRERETLIDSYPATFFINNKEPIEYTVISSTRTKTTMETGVDDDVDLFKK